MAGGNASVKDAWIGPGVEDSAGMLPKFYQAGH